MLLGHLQPRLCSVTAFLKSSGYEQIGVLGLCWGGWVGANLVTDEIIGKEFFCLAIGHPSIDAESFYFGRDAQALVDKINIPVIMLPAKVTIGS